ncbi:hypothetical protein B1B_16236, partial [mine drainage metagenome]
MPGDSLTVDWIPGPWLWATESSLPALRGFEELRVRVRDLGIDPAGYDADSNEDDETGSVIDPTAPLLRAASFGGFVYAFRKLEDDDPGCGEFGDRAVINTIACCWPESLSRAALELHVSVKTLRWHLNGRLRMDGEQMRDLAEYFGLTIGAEGERGGYDTDGTYILAARNRCVIDAYIQVGHGGDMAVSCEIVPRSGDADPRRRFLLARSCGTLFASLFVFERGALASKLLDRPASSPLINLEEKAAVSSSLYAAAASAADMASRNAWVAIHQWEEY